MSTIKEITSQTEWDDHVASVSPSTVLIISFHAPWAAPCAQMATVLQTLAAEYPAAAAVAPATSWVSVNAEELSDISEAYDVTAVPFLVIQQGGKVLETVSGSSAVKVRRAIETHAKKPAPAPDRAAAATAPNGHAKTTTNGTEPTKMTANGAEEEEEQNSETKKEDLFKRLEELVKAAPVMLFMKGTPSAPQCGFSRQLVGILRENAVKYGFFNILADDEVRQGLKQYADWPTYPQLWIDGELVGGLDIVKEEMAGNPEYLKPYSVNQKTEATGAA